MSNTQQPEALRLVEWIESDMSCDGDEAIVAELRRLHAESEQHLQEMRSYRITVDNLRARVAELEAQLSATIAAQAKQGLEAGLAAAQEGWCDGCSPDNCCGCGPAYHA